MLNPTHDLFVLLALDCEQTTIDNIHIFMFDPALVAHPDGDAVEQLDDDDAK